MSFLILSTNSIFIVVECVDLGDMELPNSKEAKVEEARAKPVIRESERDRRRSRSRDRSRERQGENRDRGRDRSRDRSRERSRDRSENLLDKVMKSSREASTSIGKNYGQRPASYKGSLSMKLDRFTVRRKSPSPDRGGRNHHHHHRESSRDQVMPVRQEADISGGSSYEQQERMKLLKNKYGDASTTTK